MDLRKEYERYQRAQQDAPKLEAAAHARGSTTSDRARAARARNQADPERLLKKVAEAAAKEARSIDQIVPPDVQRALLALMRREIKSLLPHPLRGLTDNFTDDAAPLMASLDAQGQAYWGKPELAAATGGWSGRVKELYGPLIALVDVSDASNLHGTHIAYNSGYDAENDPDIGVEKIQIYSRWYWVDVPDQGHPSAPWIVWHVADEDLDENGNTYSPKRYKLTTGATVGDICAPIVPGDSAGQLYVNDHNNDDVSTGMKILPNGAERTYVTNVGGRITFDYVRAI